VHGVDDNGKPVLVKPKVPRADLLLLIAQLSPCLTYPFHSTGHGWPNYDGLPKFLPRSLALLPAQPIDATHALNLSAGVSKANVFRGRSFN